MAQDILFSLWFLLPAACANVAPIISAAIPYLKQWQTPLDGGRTFRGKPVFGPHKTWRGIVSGVIVATGVLWLQKQVTGHTRYVDYDQLSVLPLGPLFGIGALGGDAVESFFKRQRGIVSGKRWIPFDQLDYVVGAIIISLPFISLPLRIYGYMVVLWFLMHLLASYIGYQVGLKKAPI